MSNILIINAHEPYPFAPGRLNASFVERAEKTLAALGHSVRTTTIAQGYDVEEEIEKHLSADTIILQYPVNWMGLPWRAKKYQDEVYSAGMDGRLCAGDGRTADAPTRNYGTGGTLGGKTYMLSMTFNAPKEAFDDPGGFFFQGKSVDDLMYPIHQNFRFFDMRPLASFAAHDVMKNPDIERDFQRFDAHLEQFFTPARETDHDAA